MQKQGAHFLFIRYLAVNELVDFGVLRKQYKHFFILAVFIPLQIWFEYLELTVTPKYITSIAFDKSIPFIKEFAIPYILLFPYLAYGILYTGLHSRKAFYNLIIFLAGSMAVCCALYALFPNGQNLRPIVKGNDPFSLLVRFIYATDTPTDVCPSMHVIDAIAVNTALLHTDAFSKRKHLKRISFVIMIFLCLSTVFIKQHAVFDVLCGLIVAVIFYIPLYLLPRLKVYTESRNTLDLLSGRRENDMSFISKHHKF
jgi:PAP2 superfamily.